MSTESCGCMTLRNWPLFVFVGSSDCRCCWQHCQLTSTRNCPSCRAICRIASEAGCECLHVLYHLNVVCLCEPLRDRRYRLQWWSWWCYINLGFDWILFIWSSSFGFLHCIVRFNWSDISQACTGHSHLQGDQNNHCSLHTDHFRHNKGYGRTFLWIARANTAHYTV